MSSVPLEKRVQVLEQMLRFSERRTLQLGREVASLRAERALRLAGREPVFPVEFKAQYGEDLTIREILGDQLSGFFIEVGAHDGVYLSVSYAFEAMGWKGLLIEALPDEAEACRKNRPNSRVVQAALAGPGSPPTATFTLTAEDSLMSYLDASTAGQIGQRTDTPKRQITVPVTTMNALLADHQGPIDFASIDVEGGEMELLKGFDLARFAPRVLLIEDNSLIEPIRTGIAEYMAGQPYVQVAQPGVNRVYVHRGQTEVLKRLHAAARGR